jgi:hypothetical protein
MPRKKSAGPKPPHTSVKHKDCAICEDQKIRTRTRTWLPRAIVLHPGYTIHVRLMTKGTAQWTEESRTVWIVEGSERRMLESFGHELLHAAADFNYRAMRTAFGTSSRERRGWLSKLKIQNGRSRAVGKARGRRVAA